LSFLEIPADDRRGRLHYPLRETSLHKNVQAMVGFLSRLGMDLEVEGGGNLPLSGGVVVAANHLTDIDVLPLQLALSRPLFYMDKAEVFRNRLAHALLRPLGAFPVYRGGRDEWALMHARTLLETGQVVGMFPEGTRSQGLGLKVARSDAARLALAAGCPILPVAIEGSQHLFRTFARRTRVRVVVCEPISPDPHELPLALTDRLMFTLARHLPPRLRGVYAEAPSGF
jgi:1-acyl-sn-glycerol-3-phosphate acyltransferase